MKTLQEIGLETGTDKATHHSYLPIYDALFSHIRMEEGISILEIGVHSGASARMWLEYFPYSQVYGVDLKSSPITHTRYRHFQGDTRDLGFLSTLPIVDIIIDDGSHHPDDYILAFVNLRRNVGYYYCIEDIGAYGFIKPEEFLAEGTTFYLHKNNRPDDVLWIKDFYNDCI